MPSYYSVIQYSPHPVSGEFVNVGVVTYGDGGIHCRFLGDWNRVRNFAAGKDIKWLQRFARDVQAGAGEQPTLPMDEGYLVVDERQLRIWAGSWLSNLRVSAPRAAALPSDALLESIYQDMVFERERVRRRTRSRRTAAAFVANSMQEAFGSVVGFDGADLVQKYKPVTGALETHRYDVIVSNGQVYWGAQALSFESPDESELIEDVRLAAWDISDVTSHAPNLPLAVVALPPKRKSEAFDLAHRLIGGLGASFVIEDEFPDWSRNLVRNLPLNPILLAAHG